MFIPYKTDAPIYYWPYATVLLIAVNVVAHVGQYTNDITSQWMLTYDGALHPAQWITSNFLHHNPLHLIGNMFFLWPFGMLVEGKVGWWKFLLIYFGIGIVQSACEQAVMLPFSTMAAGSLGASAVIFGLIGVAWVWAPRNEVTCLFIFFIIFLVRTVEVEISILVFGAFMLAWELLFVIFGSSAGSQLLHISGAVIGVGVGLAMLKLGLVDCEGYDVLSVFRDKEGQRDSELLNTIHDPTSEEASDFQKEAARAQFRRYVRSGNPEAAVRLRRKLQEQGQPLDLDRPEAAALITAFHRKKLWRDSAPVMAEYIERFTEDADRVRVKLAQICLVELERPQRAMELLRAVDAAALPDDHRRLYQKLVTHAKRMEADGTLELDDTQW